MNRRAPALVILLGLTACARVFVDGGTGGAGGATSAATTSGAGGQSSDAGACSQPPPPSATPPTEPGCYVNKGDGWIAVPCDCELWLENTTQAPLTGTVELTMTPAGEVPTLDGSLDVEIAFDDPEASLYATWANQAGNGRQFTIATAGGTTTVRMGASAVTLAPVPVAGCKTEKAIARVVGSFTAVLHMRAVVNGGGGAVTTDATCNDLPHE